MAWPRHGGVRSSQGIGRVGQGCTARVWYRGTDLSVHEYADSAPTPIPACRIGHGVLTERSRSLPYPGHYPRAAYQATEWHLVSNAKPKCRQYRALYLKPDNSQAQHRLANPFGAHQQPFHRPHARAFPLAVHGRRLFRRGLHEWRSRFAIRSKSK